MSGQVGQSRNTSPGFGAGAAGRSSVAGGGERSEKKNDGREHGGRDPAEPRPADSAQRGLAAEFVHESRHARRAGLAAELERAFERLELPARQRRVPLELAARSHAPPWRASG